MVYRKTGNVFARECTATMMGGHHESEAAFKLDDSSSINAESVIRFLKQRGPGNPVRLSGGGDPVYQPDLAMLLARLSAEGMPFRVVHFVRRPSAAAVSDYFFNLNSPEEWTKKPMSDGSDGGSLGRRLDLGWTGLLGRRFSKSLYTPQAARYKLQDSYASSRYKLYACRTMVAADSERAQIGVGGSA